jgi:hypothetical protein
MDGRVFDVAENIARKHFHLSDSYKVSSCVIKSGGVKLEMHNELILLNITLPMELIDAEMSMQPTNSKPVDDEEDEELGETEDKKSKEKKDKKSSANHRKLTKNKKK